MKCTVLVLCILFLPGLCDASIEISEIAWMGTEVSANDEWIELHNSGESVVDLTGWLLTDGEALHIELTGAVGAGQFIVLERTNDDSSSVPAFLIYSGALKNSGATLTLRNAASELVDQVEGGTNWIELGGSNRTKETAQRTSDGWITAPATPGMRLSEEIITRLKESSGSLEMPRLDPVSGVTQGALTPLTDTNMPRVPMHEIWPYFGLFSVISVAIGGVVMGRRRNENA